MTILLATINTRHVYRSLALPQLVAACAGRPWADRVRTAEFSLQESQEAIFARLCDFDPAMVGFSCYLWNVERHLALARMLEAVRPGVRILLGGPEASGRPGALLSAHPEVDWVLCGEADEAFPALVDAWVADPACPGLAGRGVPGLALREVDRGAARASAVRARGRRWSRSGALAGTHAQRR